VDLVKTVDRVGTTAGTADRVGMTVLVGTRTPTKAKPNSTERIPCVS